ncbi:MAG TPA: hypothetical protein VEC16_01210 [Alphaproteobacteria bacterium]|nr:hypothetical protein [Alphaproteobacteria bacterium]
MNKLSIFTVFAFLVLGLALTGCQSKENTPPNMTVEGSVNSNSTTNLSAPVLGANNDKEEDYKDVSYTITATEGDLVTLKLKAVDPDGSEISFDYGKPFNDQGLWQTKDGDAGKYLVRVSASDSLTDTAADVLVVINSRNKGPIIDCPDEVNVKEGETVVLDCKFLDKENDDVKVEYTGWMTSTTYTTNFESAGEHTVLVRATDGLNNVTKTVIIDVTNVPRAPVFNEHLKDLTVTETDIVTLKPDVMVPDAGEKVTLKFSEPFDSNGVWKSKLGDAGTYPITVVATSQGLSTKESFTLTVKMLNTAPVMKLIPNITVDEGETVKITPDVTDREKDKITISYSGWMKTDSYTTSFDDAYPKGCDSIGCSKKFKVTVTATDGVYSVSQDVYVTVSDKNRAPVFIWP